MNMNFNKILIVNYPFKDKYFLESLYPKIAQVRKDIKSLISEADESWNKYLLEGHILVVPSSDPSALPNGVIPASINFGIGKREQGINKAEEISEHLNRVLMEIGSRAEQVMFLSHGRSLRHYPLINKMPNFLYREFSGEIGLIYQELIYTSSNSFYPDVISKNDDGKTLFKKEVFDELWPFYWLEIIEKLKRFQEKLADASIDPESDNKELILRIDNFLAFFQENEPDYDDEKYFESLGIIRNGEILTDNLDRDTFNLGKEFSLLAELQKRLNEKDIDKLNDFVKTLEKLKKQTDDEKLLKEALVQLNHIIKGF
jgi:hypothetical protein